MSRANQNTGRWAEADIAHMRRALNLATASSASEIPVGAVLVRDGEVLGEAANCPIGLNDPTAHAEVQALRAAGVRTRNYRLPGTTIYVTLEPCVMCVGALLLARVDRLIFAARDLRFGAVRSKFRLADSELLNHKMTIQEGLMAAEAGELLNEFFQLRRSGSGQV